VHALCDSASHEVCVAALAAMPVRLYPPEAGLATRGVRVAERTAAHEALAAGFHVRDEAAIGVAGGMGTVPLDDRAALAGWQASRRE
jgi:hypothetical protein